ncbi:MAG: DMT family transporter, partial [Pseudomonadota bacterium]
GGVDLGLLRFAAPALLLAPFWARGSLAESLKPRSASWPALAGLLAWGAPFVLFASKGLEHGTAAHMAALVPGSMPLWAAALGALLLGERIAPARRLGLALIAAALALLFAGALAAEDGGAAFLGGAPWFLGAALCWAAFTVSFKRAGLSPLRAAGLVAFYATALLGLAALAGGSRLPALPLDELARLVALHGALSGVVSVAAFGAAIALLGAGRASAFSALVPALAALFAVLLLGERPSAAEWAAILTASLGVAVVNDAFASRRARRGGDG